jgi:hypothetical protein
MLELAAFGQPANARLTTIRPPRESGTRVARESAIGILQEHREKHRFSVSSIPLQTAQ